MSQEEGTRPDRELLVRAVSAALFACDEPVDARELGQAFGDVPLEEIQEALDRLELALEQSEIGLRLEAVAGGYRLATRPDVGSWVRRFMRERNRARLSPAALETLAVVSYRQPVTAPEIQAIRGKDPAASLKTLLDKRLLRLLGRKKVVGNPLLYGTSKEFLIHFGLNSLEDLPAIEEFDAFVEGLAEAAEDAAVPEETPTEAGAEAAAEILEDEHEPVEDSVARGDA